MLINTKSLSKIIKVGVIICLLITLPISAEAVTEPSNFSELVGIFLTLINGLIPVVFALTFTVLVFFVIKDWILVGSEESIKNGKNRLLIGVIALAVMSGVWGLIALLKTSLFG